MRTEHLPVVRQDPATLDRLPCTLPVGSPQRFGSRFVGRSHWFHGVGFRVDLSGQSVESRMDSRIAHKERFALLEQLKPTEVSRYARTSTGVIVANVTRTRGIRRFQLIASLGWPLAGSCPSTRPIRLRTSGRNVVPAFHRTWIDPFPEQRTETRPNTPESYDTQTSRRPHASG
jgi:hypothetical protein